MLSCWKLDSHQELQWRSNALWRTRWSNWPSRCLPLWHCRALPWKQGRATRQEWVAAALLPSRGLYFSLICKQKSCWHVIQANSCPVIITPLFSHLQPWALLFHHVSRLSSSYESVDKIQTLESRGNMFICKLELSFFGGTILCPSCWIYTYCNHIATCVSFLCGKGFVRAAVGTELWTPSACSSPTLSTHDPTPMPSHLDAALCLREKGWEFWPSQSDAPNFCNYKRDKSQLCIFLPTQTILTCRLAVAEVSCKNSEQCNKFLSGLLD